MEAGRKFTLMIIKTRAKPWGTFNTKKKKKKEQCHAAYVGKHKLSLKKLWSALIAPFTWHPKTVILTSGQLGKCNHILSVSTQTGLQPPWHKFPFLD